MCLASTLQSDKTVTAVAIARWFVRCGLIPAVILIVFITMASVDSPTGELEYQILSLSGLKFFKFLLTVSVVVVTGNAVWD